MTDYIWGGNFWDHSSSKENWPECPEDPWAEVWKELTALWQAVWLEIMCWKWGHSTAEATQNELVAVSDHVYSQASRSLS